MRHVITGGCGFVGKNLLNNLISDNQEVVCIDNRDVLDDDIKKKIKFIHGDIRDSNDLKKLELGCDDVVYHLAARQFGVDVPKSNERVDWFEDVNVKGTENLLNVMRENQTHKMIFFSTDMTYGIPQSNPVKTNHPQVPLGPYGASKVKAENIIRSFGEVNASIFRPRLITGYGRLGILGKLFFFIKNNLPIPMIGDGSNKYQMVNVEDCVTAANLAVKNGVKKCIYNLGSKNPPSTKELLQAIVNHAGSKSILIKTPSSLIKSTLSFFDSCGLTVLYPEQYLIADENIVLDTEDVFFDLGWVPSLSDIDGMCRAYDNYLEMGL